MESNIVVPLACSIQDTRYKIYTPNANMADLSVGPGLVARKRG